MPQSLPAVPFFKLSGAGNDFIALSEPLFAPDPETVSAWCRRGVSVGADGVMVLHRQDGRVHLDHRNADGTHADLCLNGTRCAVRLACHLGWHRQHRVELQTGAGSLQGRQVSESSCELTLPWQLDPPLALELPVSQGAYSGHRAVVGVPHWVHFIELDPATFDLHSVGPGLRHHELLAPQGANINIVRAKSDHEIEIRTWERGVEGETLACGTGAIAAVHVGHRLGHLGQEVAVKTAGGFELEVGLHEDGLRLAGDTRIVASGEIWPEP